MTAVRQFANRFTHKNQKGFVLPMVAICLGTLILFVGFGVDVSSWYLRASRIQRASDAAALAAAAKMPDIDAATLAAQSAASKNGFIDGQGGIHVELTPMLPNRFKVEIVDSHVQTFFARAAIDHITLDRKSTGEFLNSVPLGSPFSYLGTGPLATGNSAVPEQNYWLAVNGWCTSKEDGDLFLSAFDGNKGTRTSTATTCPGVSGSNPDYHPDGYNFIVEVPVGGGPAYAQIYDAAYNYGTAGTPDASAAHTGEPTPSVTTTYTLWDTNFTDELADDEFLETKIFTTNDPTPKASQDWWQFSPKLTNTNGSLPHKYRVQVQTKQGELQSWGVNSFGLRALDNGSTKACDSRITSKCPSVYGQNAMSVFANLNPSGGTAAHTVTFYLAKVDAGYAGDPMTVSMWDPGDPAVVGEIGKTISLIAPDGSKQPVYWSAVPDPGTYSGFGNAVDVSGTGPQPGASGTRFGDSKFNDRRIDMTFQLPTTYPAMVSAAKTDWWKIEYKLPTSSTPSDRATWSVTISGSDPVHLVRY